MAEINYWRAREKNLESVYEQLQDDRVHKMALVLSGTESAYYASFTNFFKNVVTGKRKQLIVRVKKGYCRFLLNFPFFAHAKYLH